MLKNFLTVALRHLRRQKGYAFINVGGLALGLACCLLIGLYLWGELSFDRHHEHAEEIYRIGLERIYPNNTVWWAPVAPAVAAGVRDAHPEVVAATRLNTQNQFTVRYGDTQIDEDDVAFVDPSFTDVFTVPFLRGHAADALGGPTDIVLTEEAARRYFGEADPLGEVLVFDDTLSLTVTGVIATPPETAHFDYDFLRPFNFQANPQFEHVWDTAFGFYTYVRLQPGASAEALEAKFREMERVHVGGAFDSDEDYQEWLASGNAYRFFLQPLTDIHLHSDLKWEINPNGDAAYVYLFGAVALFILLLAVINFMNLTTARSAERMREVGVRKAIGSHRGQLVQQFLTESVLMSAAALGLALGLAYLVLPALGDLVGRSLSMSVFGRPTVLLGLFGFTLATGILAGSYPAFYLSGFRPAQVLKGLSGAGSPSKLRNGLVVTQFAIAVVLIVGTVVVYEQVAFMTQEKLDLGEDLVLVLEDAEQLGGQTEAFRDEVLRDPNVVGVSYASGVPSLVVGASTFRWIDTPEQPVNATVASADPHYLPTLDLALKMGSNFTEQAPTDTVRKALLNETAARMLGLPDDPVGETILEFTEDPYTVVGILEDFHFESLRSEIRPYVVLSQWGPLGFPPSMAAVRIRSADVPATLASLEQTWTEFLPERSFAYTFLDDEYAALYTAERATGRLFLAFTTLAVLIACLGLFGLAAFTAERRKKEIGIRKVIGAPVLSLVTLISREFVALVGIGFAVAAPVAYLLMGRWLEGFAYRTEIGPSVFVFAGGLALFIALATVAYHALRAATADPVQALRSE